MIAESRLISAGRFDRPLRASIMWSCFCLSCCGIRRHFGGGAVDRFCVRYRPAAGRTTGRRRPRVQSLCWNGSGR